MKRKQLRLAVQRIGPLRDETLMGRAYRVFPAVLVREKVLRNNLGVTFLPAEEIEVSVDAWNGVPVVLRHPTRRGRPISARSPAVLNARGLGHVFGAAWDADRRALTGEVWVAQDRMTAVPDAEVALNAVEEGTPGEVSTGMGIAVEDRGGVFDGERYDIILRQIQPDHLALLPDEVGACSIADGCGLGVNSAEELDEPEPVTTEPPMTDPEPAVNAADPPATEDPPTEDPPAEPATATGDVPWNITVNCPPGTEPEGVLARLTRRFRQWMGVDNEGVENESDEDRRELLTQALRDAFGGDRVYIWIAAVFSDDGLVVFERESPQDTGLFRTTFSIGEDGAVTLGDLEEVRRVTTFEPVANAGDHPTPTQEGDTMNRDEMIAQLAERSPLTADTLKGLDDAALTALHGKFPAETEGAPAGDGAAAANAEPAAVATGIEVGTLEPPEWAKNLAESVTALNAKVEQFGEVMAPAVAQQTEEREALIADLAANVQVPFEEAELKGKALGELRKLQSMVRPTTAGTYFGARGAPRPATNAGEDEPAFMPPKSYTAKPADAATAEVN